MASRLGGFVESFGHHNTKDALTWSNAKFFAGKHPEIASRVLLTATLELRLQMGKRDAGSPPKIVLYDRDDALAFFAILKLEALAFLDDVVVRDWIRRPEDTSSIQCQATCHACLLNSRSTSDMPVPR